MKKVERQIITFTVNGKEVTLVVGDGKHEVSPSETLATTLRNRLDLLGLKIGCDQGACGCCSVIADGKAILSCMTLTVDCDGFNITTIEGLEDKVTGDLNGLQQAFLDNSGYQCGFCIPGIVMTAQALVDEVENPTEEEVREALAGNYCRCGTHYSAVDAIMSYLKEREEKRHE
jgi:Aerobic-type carbon monoxide dehydrogenase, small subunit CoxS/CutS homologs